MNTPSNPVTPSSTEAKPPTSVAPPQPPTRRSGRARKVLKKEGNIYGDKHPVQIEQDICRKKDWDRIVGEQSSHPHPNVPGPSTPVPVPLLLTSPKRVPQVVRRKSLTPRVKLKALLNLPLALRKRSSSPNLPRKGEYISNISLSQKRSHQMLKTHPQRNGPIETS